MTDRWKELRDQLARYRILEQEATDPLAAGLLRDIVSELEADLKALAEMDDQRTAARDLAPDKAASVGAFGPHAFGSICA